MGYARVSIFNIPASKKNHNRRVITSSTDHKTIPKNVKLQKGEIFINPGPHLVRRPVRDSQGKIIKENGKIKKKTYERIEINGEATYKPYDIKTQTGHHAEQRGKKTVRKDEAMTSMCPSRTCCSGCQNNLGENISKVPYKYRSKENYKEVKQSQEKAKSKKE